MTDTDRDRLGQTRHSGGDIRSDAPSSGRPSPPVPAGKSPTAVVAVNQVIMRYPVHKRYRDYLLSPLRREYVTALDKVSLVVQKGECLGLLGPNGAGKTTLLKLIGGLLYPTEGSVVVDGHDTVAHNDEVRSRVGFVLNEERSFYWRLTGFQNLEFFGALNNMHGPKCRRRIDQLLHLVGLDGAGGTRVANYSCGMRQRLAIARGLLDDPDVLILDEPTKSLDPHGAMELRTLIADEVRLRNGKTLIMATHQVDEAELLCDRILIIASGHVAAGGRTGNIKESHGGISAFYNETFSRMKTERS